MIKTGQSKDKPSFFKRLFTFNFGDCCRSSRSSNALNKFRGKNIAVPLQRYSSSGQYAGSSSTSTPFASHYGKGMRRFTGTFETDKPSLSKSYPINEIFILGTRRRIVAKITVRKIAEGPTVPNGMNLSLGVFSIEEESSMIEDSTSNAFSMLKRSGSNPFGKKVRLSATAISFVSEVGITDYISDNIARHIAHRLKCDAIIDAYCNYGEIAIQFAKHCRHVVALNTDANKLNVLNQNIKACKLTSPVDAMMGDFLDIKGLKADIVFLNPINTFKDVCLDTEGFSLFKHMKPELTPALKKALECSSKVAIRLPGYTDLDEIVSLFYTVVQKENTNTERFSIEIEKILNSEEQPEHILVLFGDCSSIDLKEEHEAIYEQLSQYDSPNTKLYYPFHVLSAIIEKVHTKTALKYMREIEKTMEKDKRSCEPMLESFLDKLVTAKHFTRQELNQLIDEELRRPSVSMANLDGSNVSEFTMNGRNISVFTNTYGGELKMKVDAFSKGNSYGAEGLLYQVSKESPFKLSNEDQPWKSEAIVKPNNKLQENYNHREEAGPTKSEHSASSYSVASNYLNQSAVDDSLASSPKETTLVVDLASNSDKLMLASQPDQKENSQPNVLHEKPLEVNLVAVERSGSLN